MAEWFRIAGERIFLDIKASPGASKTGAAGIRDGRLRVRLAAPPEGGKANAELTIFLARLLGCPKKDIVLQSGERSRLKTVSLPARAAEQLELLVEPAASDQRSAPG